LVLEALVDPARLMFHSYLLHLEDLVGPEDLADLVRLKFHLYQKDLDFLAVQSVLVVLCFLAVQSVLVVLCFLAVLLFHSFH
jgi:hypothetical protein